MIFSTLLFIQVASNPLPQPLTETHMRDIGCVATLGLIAADQRKGMASSIRFPNVMERGKTYAGIVGERIMAETGQSRDVVRLAIGQAVEDQQNRAIAIEKGGGDAKATFAELMAKCVPLLDAEVPEKAPTKDDYRFCAAIIGLSVDEIEGREGKDSGNAMVMRGLKEQLTRKYAVLAYPDDPNASMLPSLKRAEDEIKLEKLVQLKRAKEAGGLEAMAEADGEAKFQRCIFLGE